MRYSRIAALSLTTLMVALAACTDAPEQSATAPDLRVMANHGENLCHANQTNNIIRDIQGQPVGNSNALFNGAAVTQALALFANIQAACGTPAAREELLKYVRFTIVTWEQNHELINGPGDRNSKAAPITSHWNHLFHYVGYPAPGLPSDVLPLGAAKVVLGSEATAETPGQIAVEFGIPGKAAMTIYKQLSTGDRKGHLFTILGVAPPCLGETNLVQDGPCFAVTANPGLADGGKFDPGVKIGICHPDEDYAWDLNAPALGHVNGTNPLKVAGPGGNYPSEAFCHQEESLPRYGLRGLLNRLASAMSIGRAYAAHGGLGGISGTLSTFGPLDKQVFSSVGSNTSPGPLSQPSNGSLEFAATPPASINVADKLGNLTLPIVLRQPANANNCQACGALYLHALFSSASSSVYADDGVYAVSWESLQHLPKLNSAPFVIRSSDGLEVARVAYTLAGAKNNVVNQITFNGTPVGLWVKDVSQLFEVKIDINDKKTWLRINGQDVAGPVNFVNTDAENINSLRLEFSGIDAGQIAVKNIFVERLADD